MLSGTQSVKLMTLLPPTENLFVLYELFEVSKLKIVFFQFMGKLTCSHMQDISTQHHNGITLFSAYFLNGPAVCFCGWLTKLLLKALTFLSILCAVILCFLVVYIIHVYLVKKCFLLNIPRGGYS